MTKGPRTITPQPHNSCDGCDYVDKHFGSSGGLRKAPTYYMYCEHPEVMELSANSDLIPPSRSVIKFGARGENPITQRTPSWCPYLKQEKENG